MIVRSHSEVFTELAGDLPPTSALGTIDDLDEQARATLSYLVEKALALPGAWPEAVPRNPATCPNCDAPVSGTRTPYCSEGCKEMSAFIRQVRSYVPLANAGPLFVRERQIAMGEVLWRVLGGGRPRRRSLALPRTLATVFKREEGKCQVCGGPAITVDHIGSG